MIQLKWYLLIEVLNLKRIKTMAQKNDVTVNAILSKYGFTSGRPVVAEAKNIDIATKAFCKALIASGYKPTEKDNKLVFASGKFQVVFVGNDHWEMFHNDKLVDQSHYGNGSIKLVRWNMKQV